MQHGNIAAISPSLPARQELDEVFYIYVYNFNNFLKNSDKDMYVQHWSFRFV